MASRVTAWVLSILLFFATGVSSASDIVIVKSQDIPPYNESIHGFEDVAGRVTRLYDMEGDIGRGSEIVNDILATRPSLIVTLGTKASVAMAEKITDIPIVALLVSRPEKYLPPRGNISAISLNPDPLEQFRLLRRLYPAAGKIGVIHSGGNMSREIERGFAARKEMGYELIEETVSSEAEIPEALRRLREKTDALWLVMDDLVITNLSMRHFVKFSIDNRYPLIGFSETMVKGGTLFTVVTDFTSFGRQAGEAAKRMMKNGGNGGGFVFPSSTGYVLNARIAGLIGLGIPDDILKGASEIYE